MDLAAHGVGRSHEGVSGRSRVPRLATLPRSVIPPLDAAFYPADPRYAVYRVYFEFIHRVAAGLLALGTVAFVVVGWRHGMRRRATALVAILSLQIGMGAVTVWLRNAPITVVVHLALALSFLAVLIASARSFGLRLSREAPPSHMARLYRAWLVLVGMQLLLGGVVSSRPSDSHAPISHCAMGSQFPYIGTEPIAWQMAHRISRICGVPCGAGSPGRLAHASDKSAREGYCDRIGRGSHRTDPSRWIQRLVSDSTRRQRDSPCMRRSSICSGRERATS